MIEQNILMVDDRPENLIALETILEAPGRNLISADSGNKALSILLKEDVSLVLLDVQMPVMDGFEVAQLMRNNQKTQSIPIIFLTAISKEQKYVFKGYESGAVDYLFKPLEEPILKSKVEFFLLMDRQKRELSDRLKHIRKLQQRQAGLLNAIGEGIVGLDKKGNIKFSNPVANSFLADEKGELVNKHFTDVFQTHEDSEESGEWENTRIYKECSLGNRYFDCGNYYCVLNDRNVPLSFTATAINASEDEFSGAVLVVQDTSLHEANLEMSQEKVNRKYLRKRLSVLLRVFDRDTGETLGTLENLTIAGMKLKTKHLVEPNKMYNFSMVLPKQIKGSITASFSGKCKWSSQPNYSNDYAAGFQFEALDEETKEIYQTLLREY